MLFEPALFPGGDNADYMILGESLRSGAGYRDLYLPGEPIHTKYPPFYPLFLGGLGLIGGVQLFKLASLACTTAVVWLTAQIGRQRAGERVALVAAALVALNPVVLQYAHYVLSEAIFTALTLLSLYLLDGAREGRQGMKGHRWVGLAVAVAAFLTRTAGFVLLIAIPVAWAISRRPRRAAWAAATALVAMVGWALFQRLGPPGRPSYLQELLLRHPYDPEAGTIPIAGLIGRTAANAWVYASSVLPGALVGPGAGPGDGLLTLAGLLVAALVLAGWTRRAGGGLGVAELFTLLYAGLIAAWPEVWTDQRFLLPLLPLLLLYATDGASRVGELTSWRRGPPVATATLGLLLSVAAVGSVVRLAPERIDCVAAFRAGSPCDPPAQASFYRAARWAADATEPDAVVANRKPNFFFWFGRRQGDLYAYSTNPELVMSGLRELGADYVVVDQISPTTLRYLVPAIQQHRDQFELVYEGGEPPTLVFRFRPEARTALGPIHVSPER